MRKNILITLMSVLLLVALVPLAISQPMRGFHGRMGTMEPGQRMFANLNLTDEQQSQILDMRLQHQKEMLPVRTELQGKMDELRLLKIDKNPNLRRIDGKIDEISKIRTKLQKARVRHQMEVRKILTTEQQKIFDSKMLSGRGNGKFGRGFRGRMQGKMGMQGRWF